MNVDNDRKLIEKLCSVHPYFSASMLADNTYMRINQDILMKKYLAVNVEKKGITIVHPGTEQLFISSLIYSAMANIFCATIDPTNYIKIFNKGDMVLRNGKRYRFVGVENDKYIIDDGNIKISMPIFHACKIKHYEGTAASTGSKGIRKTVSVASDFLKNWVGEEYADIANALPYTTLVVWGRAKMDVKNYVGRIGLVGYGKCMYYSEVFPTAWVSNIDDFEDFAGNSSGAYPTVVFTNRISVARELLYNDTAKRIRNVIINDVDTFLSSSGELKDIFNRKTVHDVTLLTSIPSTKLGEVALNAQYCDIVYWSDQVLLSTLDDLYIQPVGENHRRIMQQINYRIDHEVKLEVIKFSTDSAYLDECKKLLKHISDNINNNGDLRDFFIGAYGLINFFEQSCFTMAEYESAILKGVISARSPKKQLEMLEELYEEHSFEQCLYEDLEMIIFLLNEMYNNLFKSNPKETRLRSLLDDVLREKASVEIIVAKRSYAALVEKWILGNSITDTSVTTPKKRDVEKLFDRRIVVAVPNPIQDSFNPYLCFNAQETLLLMYSSEEKKHNWIKREAQHINNLVHASSMESMRNLVSENEDYISDNVINDNIHEIIELEEKMASVEVDALLLRVQDGVTAGNTLHAIRLVTFEEGEWALLSEFYAPYLLDEKDEKLTTKDVKQLQEGDTLVFASQNTDIGDFVDVILQKLIENGNEKLQSQYEKYIYWKNTLKMYMNKTGKNYVEISKMMTEIGYSKHQVTIRSWLNDESKIVGPRDEDAFIAIALVTEDELMSKSPKSYKDACDGIRRLRTKILGYVHDQIMHTVVNHVTDKLGQDEVTLIGDVSRYARKLRISTITIIDREISAGIANRPLER